MTQTPEHRESSPASPAVDPLARLYRMSRTAGLGSSDYQAINTTAVAAFFLGLLSFFGVFQLELLVIPAIGVIVGLVAAVQIARSGGTQTGYGVHWLGILLSIGFAIWIGASAYADSARTRGDREALIKLVSDLGDYVRDDKLDAAYGLFSDVFRSRVTREKFDGLWKLVQQTPNYGRLKSIRSNGLFEFQADPATGLRVANGQLILNFDKSTPADRPDVLFSTRTGDWKIETIPSYFPVTSPDGRANTANPNGR